MARLYLDKFVWFYLLGRGTDSKDVREWNCLWNFKIEPVEWFSVYNTLNVPFGKKNILRHHFYYS